MVKKRVYSNYSACPLIKAYQEIEWKSEEEYAEIICLDCDTLMCIHDARDERDRAIGMEKRILEQLQEEIERIKKK